VRVRLAPIVVGMLVLGACAHGADQSARPQPGTTAVERVVDGDTIVVRGGERVRLIGMDTPETVDPRKPVQCFGEAASRRTKQLLPVGTAVRLVYDVDRYDRYGRTLAYVYRAADGLFVNASLVQDGYAVAYTVPPNVAHADQFVALQRDARRAGRGLWTKCR
jgi:micrococcal nuclease